MSRKSREQKRTRRHLHVRRHVAGTSQRPRVSVYRSLSQIYAQIIDDTTGKTLVAVSTIDKELREKIGKLKKSEQAKEVGKALAQRAQKAGIQQVVFDRGGYRYHGRVKALADAAREAGLQF
ncbi:MAG: 50S ribosomal protein L18 [Anaerolineales bacterium]